MFCMIFFGRTSNIPEMSWINQNLIYIKNHNHEAKTLEHDCSLVILFLEPWGLWALVHLLSGLEESEARDDVGKEP